MTSSNKKSILASSQTILVFIGQYWSLSDNICLYLKYCIRIVYHWYSLLYEKIEKCVCRFSTEEPQTLEILVSELIRSPHGGTWGDIPMMGCPLSAIFAALVLILGRVLCPVDKLLRERAGARMAQGDFGDGSKGSITIFFAWINDVCSTIPLVDLSSSAATNSMNLLSHWCWT